MLPYGQGLLCVASETRQTWEKWGQDPLLSVGVSDTTRGRSALFPRTGGSLAKFYGAFWMRLLLGTHLRVPCHSCKSRIWASSLLVLPGRHSQLLHCRLLVKDLAG